jgi:hypothetical protein
MKMKRKQTIVRIAYPHISSLSLFLRHQFIEYLVHTSQAQSCVLVPRKLRQNRAVQFGRGCKLPTRLVQASQVVGGGHVAWEQRELHHLLVMVLKNKSSKTKYKKKTFNPL